MIARQLHDPGQVTLRLVAQPAMLGRDEPCPHLGRVDVTPPLGRDRLSLIRGDIGLLGDDVAHDIGRQIFGKESKRGHRRVLHGVHRFSGLKGQKGFQWVLR